MLFHSNGPGTYRQLTLSHSRAWMHFAESKMQEEKVPSISFTRGGFDYLIEDIRGWPWLCSALMVSVQCLSPQTWQLLAAKRRIKADPLSLALFCALTAARRQRASFIPRLCLRATNHGAWGRWWGGLTCTTSVWFFRLIQPEKVILQSVGPRSTRHVRLKLSRLDLTLC